MTVENDPLIGQKFGKLKVVELSGFYVKPSDGKREQWELELYGFIKDE